MARGIRTDPWWDLEGAGVRRDRLRRRIVSAVAFALALSATGIVCALWYRLLEPVVPRLLG
jgi:hypothetical protein